MSALRFRVLALLFFASGVAGLVDEVAFFKYLSLVFGATAYASSAVLVAFMGGLALGSFAASRLEKRTARPLLAYAGLELAVGGICALSPFLFGLVTRAYVSFAAGAGARLFTLTILRSALASVVVLMPAVAMGATLPLVARAVRGALASSRLAILYGLNTAGGAVGSLISAYAVLPALGLATTLRASAALSATLGVVALFLGRGEPSAAPPLPGPRTSQRPAEGEGIGALLTAAVASGLFVFACEVVFVHTTALLVGTSVYVFGLILFIFLVALAAGAALSRPLVRAARASKSSALAWSFAATALSLALSLPLWDRLPDLFIALGPRVTSFAGRELVRGLVAFLAIFAPVACMGTSFPLLLDVAGARSDAGRVVGRITAVNTVGSIAGSLLGGFVVLPVLGSQKSLVLVAAGYAFVAVGFRKLGPAVVAAAAVLCGTLLPAWNMARLAGGANVYFEPPLTGGAKVVWVKEDVHGGVTTVTEGDGVFTLFTNGKFQGDNGFQMTAQHGFANLPMLFVREPKTALVIGLGTGTTTGALAAYPFERIDVAELSPAIVEAAHDFFAGVNRGVLDDPRVNVLREDGRNVLLVRQGDYDLVSIELTSIWFAGAGNLYNKEFYEIARRRLRPGGILQQWVQLHHTTRREIAVTLATARAVFPHAMLFVRGEQGILVLSMEPLEASRARLAALEAREEVGEILAGGHLEDGLADAVLADETLDAFIAEVAGEHGLAEASLISTDDNLKLEYATPRNNVPGLLSTYQTGAMLRAYRDAEVIGRHLAP